MPPCPVDGTRNVKSDHSTKDTKIHCGAKGHQYTYLKQWIGRIGWRDILHETMIYFFSCESLKPILGPSVQTSHKSETGLPTR